MVRRCYRPVALALTPVSPPLSPGATHPVGWGPAVWAANVGTSRA